MMMMLMLMLMLMLMMMMMMMMMIHNLVIIAIMMINDQVINKYNALELPT